MSYEAPDKFFNSLYAQPWASLVVQWLKKKSLPANAGDVGSIPGLGRPLGEGHGTSL